MTAMSVKLLKSTTILLFIAASAISIDAFLFFTRPMPITADFIYEMKPGASLKRMSQDLATLDVIKRPVYLTWWARINGQAKQIKVGEYQITRGMTPLNLLEAMVQGKVIQYALTLVEGWTFWQMMDYINQSELLIHNLRDLSDEEIMKRLGYEGQHPEGRFFPDTYHFPKGMDDVRFLQRAYMAMQQKLEQAWQQRDLGLPFKDPYEALILASIVEKESALPSERKLIAGVFINRLRKGMRLQTDPTVIYGLGRNFDGDIRFRDLKNDTPYNTYTRKGLPPTPIAMPGQG
ncbi:MAG: endolytic transglycosylase MltG, partial [Gammaproteobacteria bacterium]